LVHFVSLTHSELIEIVLFLYWSVSDNDEFEMISTLCCFVWLFDFDC
jgi:hypothetical protein